MLKSHKLCIKHVILGRKIIFFDFPKKRSLTFLTSNTYANQKQTTKSYFFSNDS